MVGAKALAGSLVLLERVILKAKGKLLGWGALGNTGGCGFGVERGFEG